MTTNDFGVDPDADTWGMFPDRVDLSSNRLELVILAHLGRSRALNHGKNKRSRASYRSFDVLPSGPALAAATGHHVNSVRRTMRKLRKQADTAANVGIEFQGPRRYRLVTEDGWFKYPIWALKPITDIARRQAEDTVLAGLHAEISELQARRPERADGDEAVAMQASLQARCEAVEILLEDFAGGLSERPTSIVTDEILASARIKANSLAASRSGAAKILFLHFCRHYFTHQDAVKQPYDDIVEALKMKRDTISKAIQLLEDAQVITVTRHHFPDGTKSTSSYAVNERRPADDGYPSSPTVAYDTDPSSPTVAYEVSDTEESTRAVERAQTRAVGRAVGRAAGELQSKSISTSVCTSNPLPPKGPAASTRTPQDDRGKGNELRQGLITEKGLWAEILVGEEPTRATLRRLDKATTNAIAAGWVFSQLVIQLEADASSRSIDAAENPTGLLRHRLNDLVENHRPEIRTEEAFFASLSRDEKWESFLEDLSPEVSALLRSYVVDGDRPEIYSYERLHEILTADFDFEAWLRGVKAHTSDPLVQALSDALFMVHMKLGPATFAAIVALREATGLFALEEASCVVDGMGTDERQEFWRILGARLRGGAPHSWVVEALRQPNPLDAIFLIPTHQLGV